MCPPKEYEACRDSEMRSGKPEKKAKKMCAIAFWKRHGVSVNEAHKGKKK